MCWVNNNRETWRGLEFKPTILITQVACYTVTYGLDAAKTAGDVGNFTTDMVTCGYSWGENPRNIGNIGYHVSRIMANKFFGKGYVHWLLHCLNLNTLYNVLCFFFRLLQQITGQTTDGKYTLEGNFPEFRLLMDGKKFKFSHCCIILFFY
jgi:hypothetical protein